jgi:GNAT superfamily N-acetyltransferase
VGTERTFRLSPATEGDVPALLRMIRSLADFERLAHKVAVTEAQLHEVLFGARPLVEAVIAFDEDEPAGFAVFFPTFSTFAGTPGIYLEDLFVEPRWRGLGLGRRLLAYVASVAVARGWPRVTWSVLDWNDTAIGFYRGLGAEPIDGWVVFGLSGEALTRVAERGDR